MGLAKRIQIIGAHPDDCEYACGGTSAFWRQAGAEVQFVSLTDGCSGHHEQSGAELIARRKKEAHLAADIIGASCQVLDIADGHLEATLENRLKVIRLVREFKPDLVITNRPNDYHADHRYTAQLVQDASFLLRVPNVLPEVRALDQMPVIAYFWDAFQKPYPFETNCVVAIDVVFETKLRQLAAHESQFMEWLPWLDGKLHEVPPASEPEARLEWLKNYFNWLHTPSIAQVEETAVIERYGVETYKLINQVEAFELCEYGKQPQEGEFSQLFPM
jgi:LmbE family N-acetylglucosaminyl deacetylase